MLSRVRVLWRRARNIPILRRLLLAGDRFWWARTIRRANVVDVSLVAAQGHRGSTRSAIRRYVRDGFRTGFSLNPLLMERLVASQLSDVGRVPALYAYLVNEPGRVEASVNWDSKAHSRIPGALGDPGGPLGHAWRNAAAEGSFPLVGAVVPWRDIQRATLSAARQANGEASRDLAPLLGPVVLVCRIDDGEDAAAPLRVAATIAGTGAPVVLALSGANADQWISASQLTLRFPEVQLARDRTGLLDEIRSHAPEAVIVVRGPSGDISAAELLALAHVAAAEESVTVPVWVDAADGTIVSAGVGFHGGGGFDILSAHPTEDLSALVERTRTPAVRGDTVAIPAHPHGEPVVLTSAVVRTPSSGSPQADPAQPDTVLSSILPATRFSVAGWGQHGPILKRTRATVTLDDGETVPRLRWAIKIAAPPGPRGEWWGDTHFARGIAAALGRLGQEVVIDAYAARERTTTYLDDVVLALRGPEPIHPIAGTKSLLWIISHPDEIRETDLDGYDVVFAASSMWADSASSTFGREIRALRQCTDIERFRAQGTPRSRELVFVGTARGIPRPSIIEPLKAGIPVSVYGPDWSGWISGDAIKGSGIANADLPAVYEGAGAVLNDHWPAMKEAGFISNRLYDVVAAGGRAISDDVTGIAEIFGGAVVTYRDIPELLDLAGGDLDRRFADDEELHRIAARVRREDSFDARAATLLRAALED